MPEYTKSDLIILNSIDTIRACPHLYSGGDPVEYSWMDHLVRDLLFQGAESIGIKKVGDWWRVSSSKDWLEKDGVISMLPFSKIIHFPVAGQNAMRNEVVIAALSKALLTVGADGTNWIAGSPEDFKLPNELATEITDCKSGRMIAFLAR